MRKNEKKKETEKIQKKEKIIKKTKKLTEAMLASRASPVISCDAVAV